ncbi:MAG TPA: arsenic resistance N-acetyltransferase ArsN2 [Steroidobacteraceae bacterium]|nr:arsenic resistance N-acetyltransferase ArsN2 [Steroidobacteraceae bacterium]
MLSAGMRLEGCRPVGAPESRFVSYIPAVKRAPAFSMAARPTRSGAIRLLESVDLPTSDLYDGHFRDFFFIGTATEPVGIVGLELHGECALLRSLAVTPSARAAGAGTALVELAESHARSHGVRNVYLLTTTAEDFFARRGYARIGREAAPDAIRSTREFADICPAGSAFMVKHLPK